jgi:hypothetical protein
MDQQHLRATVKLNHRIGGGSMAQAAEKTLSAVLFGKIASLTAFFRGTKNGAMSNQFQTR